MKLSPINQIELYGFEDYFFEFIRLIEENRLPNKILLSGQKGLGKATFSYHLINYVLSSNEEFKYDIKHFVINPENHSFKTVVNKSNPNFILIDVEKDKKSIDIDQIRKLILNLNKSSFNNKPKFVLIDNIDLLNIFTVNALLKVMEEPLPNVHFILINNEKKKFSTLFSRCINFRIYLTNKEIFQITKRLFKKDPYDIINRDLINYYFSPGSLYNFFAFGLENGYNLKDLTLKELLSILINKKYYKDNHEIKILILELIEFYFVKNLSSLKNHGFDKYNYFIKRLFNINKYNLDEESYFIEFNNKVLNG